MPASEISRAPLRFRVRSVAGSAARSPSLSPQNSALRAVLRQSQRVSAAATRVGPRSAPAARRGAARGPARHPLPRLHCPAQVQRRPDGGRSGRPTPGAADLGRRAALGRRQPGEDARHGLHRLRPRPAGLRRRLRLRAGLRGGWGRGLQPHHAPNARVVSQLLLLPPYLPLLIRHRGAQRSSGQPGRARPPPPRAAPSGMCEACL